MSKKDAYIAKAQAKIDEQAAKLRQLKAQVEGKVADQRIDAHAQIEKLEAKLESAKTRLTEVAAAAEGAWEEYANRFDSLVDDLGGGIKRFFGK